MHLVHYHLIYVSLNLSWSCYRVQLLSMNSLPFEWMTYDRKQKIIFHVVLLGVKKYKLIGVDSFSGIGNVVAV